MSALFGPDGSLSRHISGFAPRPQQQSMAEAVARALENNGVLIAEAGTGTGKTFAYLAPALLSGKKIIISTGTRNLQDQLYHKDLPLIRKALERPVRVAMLKGRSNYLCLHRLERLESDGRLTNRRQVSEFGRVHGWAGRTRRGDIAEVSDVAEDSALWPKVTSTVDNCLGADCPHLKDCFVMKARREAQEADILVVNHHLFFADMAVKQEGFAEVLPGADAFILDEAHQLPEVAGHFFGLSLSSRQLHDLAQDTRTEQLRDARDFTVLVDQATGLEKSVADFRLALGEQPRREPWHKVAALPEVTEAVAAVRSALEELHSGLHQAAERGKGLDSCYRRCEDMLARLERITETVSGGNVHWFETQARSFSLNLTPLDIGPLFHQHMADYQAAWVFTSATLAVRSGFDHFAASLGLSEIETLCLPSPFDFPRHAVLYHPSGLPDPAAPRYTEALIEAVLPVLQASRGRAFILFTSHRAMREAAGALTSRLEFPLLLQGSLPKNELLTQFRRMGNAVLLGTASFWEGVDVRGEALSCVIIAKLPFATPSDPVLQARLDALRRQGTDPFTAYQLPHAVIALKQGVGRLIRDVNDRGVLMLCDPRLLTKPYGQVFLDSLPPMTRTRKLERVQQFFALEADRDVAATLPVRV